MKCVTCNDIAVVRELCMHHYYQLPYETRRAYDQPPRNQRRLSTKQAVAILQQRTASVKMLRGGRHSGDRT